MPENVYVYYSGATDVTGKKIVEALEATGGTTKPNKEKAVVIGWGAKTNGKVNLGNAVVLNHPDQIKENRNKFNTLKMLKDAGVAVANFASAESVMAALKSGDVTLPLVGRRNFHQGGKGFWLCMTKGHVEKAIQADNGAQYFQNFIPIKDEFRLHIFDDECIYAVKKVERENLQEAFIEQQGEKVKNIAAKKKVDLDEATMNFVLERLGKREEHPDQVIRSNLRGWKFSKVKAPDKVLVNEAVKALKAANLNFGAVDCCIDEDGNPWIIEINSGPGLQESTFDAWIEKFKDTIDKILNPPKQNKKVKPAEVKKDLNDAAPQKQMGNKFSLQQKLATIQELVDKADDDEAAVIAKVVAKLFKD